MVSQSSEQSVSGLLAGVLKYVGEIALKNKGNLIITVEKISQSGRLLIKTQS